jgi:3-hydroxyisobutyrate dehydrogenase
MKVGFIGLGNMGAPIARRLVRQGLDVTGSDVSTEALMAFDEPGAAREADPVKTAKVADVLGVCVRTDAQLESLLGDGTVFEALGEGGVLVLNSTVAPSLARVLAKQAASYGVGFIDVGVSGGAALALEGKLSLFVGGDQAALEKAGPFLDAIGTVAHLGPVGRGLEGKLLNNLLSIANFGMSALILDLGSQLNFDRVQLQKALQLGSAQCFALNVIPGLLDYNGTSTAAQLTSLHDLLEKDVVHASHLFEGSNFAMDALQHSARAMLTRIKQAAAERS